MTVTIDSLPSKSASKKGSISVDAGDTAYLGGIPGRTCHTIKVFLKVTEHSLTSQFHLVITYCRI